MAVYDFPLLMKKALKFGTGLVALVVLLVVARGPLRLRRLNHNFDFVQNRMSEAEVIQILGEQGVAQDCTRVPKGSCDHEVVYHLRFPDFLAIEFDKQGRVIGKWRSP